MRVEKCYFCSGPVYPGHGIAFVRNDSKVFRFCRSKCHLHFKAKHNPRKMKWTRAYRKTHGKDMIVDSTFEFEKKKNEPIKYNRDLMVQTVQAIKKVNLIKERRDKDFWKLRMMKAKVHEKDRMEAELNQHITLVSEPSVKLKLKANLLEKETAKEEANTLKNLNRKKKKADVEPIEMDVE